VPGWIAAGIADVPWFDPERRRRCDERASPHLVIDVVIWSIEETR